MEANEDRRPTADDRIGPALEAFWVKFEAGMAVFVFAAVVWLLGMVMGVN